MAVHPDPEGLDASYHQEAVERGEHSADGILKIVQPVGDRLVVQCNESRDRVAVAAKVFGAAVDDDVGPEEQGTLKVRRKECIIDYKKKPVLLCDL